MAIIRRMVKVRLDLGEPDAEISVPLRDDPAVVSAIRHSLPKLRRDMRKRWPMLADVQIRQKDRPRFSNPAGHATAFMLSDLRMVLAAIFASHIGGQIAKDIIRPPAKEIGKYLRQWVRKFTKPKPRRRAKRRTNERLPEKVKKRD